MAMKRLEGRAETVVRAPMATCFSVLATVERYPSWCGELIPEVTVLDRDCDGRARRARVVVYVAQSPFGKRFEFDAAIRSQPARAVHLSRIPSAPSDSDRFSLSWTLKESLNESLDGSLKEDQGTRLGLEFAAVVSFLPGVLPLPGVGDLIARTLIDAAAHHLDGSRAPMPGARSSV